MQMISADVYSHFVSRKLNSVVNLPEKQQIMKACAYSRLEGLDETDK